MPTRQFSSVIGTILFGSDPTRIVTWIGRARPGDQPIAGFQFIFFNGTSPTFVSIICQICI